MVALNLITLHRSDGGDVSINPAQITSLRSPAGHLNRLAPSGHCIVNLVDGKFVAVMEPCAAIKRQLETIP